MKCHIFGYLPNVDFPVGAVSNNGGNDKPSMSDLGFAILITDYTNAQISKHFPAPVSCPGFYA